MKNAVSQVVELETDKVDFSKEMIDRAQLILDR